jgi:hypothetical protein
LIVGILKNICEISVSLKTSKNSCKSSIQIFLGTQVNAQNIAENYFFR